MKNITTKYNDKTVTLSCQHRKTFPPAQMYGRELEDVDHMWKTGAIDGPLHQKLSVWRDVCGKFRMDDKCVTCDCAILMTPRPGRPNVYDESPWVKTRDEIDYSIRRSKAEAKRLPVINTVKASPEVKDVKPVDLKEEPKKAVKKAVKKVSKKVSKKKAVKKVSKKVVSKPSDNSTESTPATDA